jgi:hypothetical protein
MVLESVTGILCERVMSVGLWRRLNKRNSVLMGSE